MAHAFTITDGTTTFSLTTTNSMLVNYDMGVLSNPEDEDVADTIEIGVYAASGALMQTAARTLQSLLDQARRRKARGVGKRIYVTAQLDSDGSAWRSEIFDGYLEMDERSLAVWGNYLFEARVHIKRRPYWEASSWLPLGLTNTNGSDTTSGLPIYVGNDGYGSSPNDVVNYAQWDTGDFTGDLPGALLVELTNATGSTMQINRMWLAVNNENDPANFAYIFEGEDGALVGRAVTDVADATCSNGYYGKDTNITTDQWYWSMSAAFLEDCAGMPFRVLLFAPGALLVTDGGYIQARVTDSGSSMILAAGDKVYIDETVSTPYVVDLGILYLPPMAYTANPGALRLEIKCDFSSAVTLYIDYLQVLPVYACRKLVANAVSTLSTTGAIVVDEGNERVYQVESTDYFPYWSMQGSPLLAHPGVAGRLYLASLNTNVGNNPRTDQFTIKAWGKSRRSTI